MKPNKLDKLYSEFKPIERLNLAVAAAARGDQEEKRKLFKTCPRFEYRQADTAFSDKYDKLFDIGLIVMVEWEKIAGAVGLFHSITELFNDQQKIYKWIIESVEQNKSKQEIIDQAQKEITLLKNITPLTEKIAHEKVIAIKTLIESYKQFCCEVGIKEDIALQWLKGTVILDGLIAKGLLEDIPVDEVILKTTKEQFHKFWKW